MKKISLLSLMERGHKIKEKCLASIFILLFTFLSMSCFTLVVKNNKVLAVSESLLNSGEQIESLEIKEDFVNNYIADLEKQGYQNISYIDKSGDNIVFYTEYTVLKIDNNFYNFKTEQEAIDFIDKISKYGKQEYEKFNNVVEQISEEASERELEDIILAKKKITEQIKNKTKNRKSTMSNAVAATKKFNIIQINQGNMGQSIVDYALNFVRKSLCVRRY